MLTKKDLELIRKERTKDLEENNKKLIELFRKEMRQEIRQEIHHNTVEIFAFLNQNFVTKQEFDPFKEDVKQLKYDMNIVKDMVADLHDLIHTYMPLANNRIDRAHQRIDNLESKILLN